MLLFPCCDSRSIRKRRGRSLCEFQLKVTTSEDEYGNDVDTWQTQFTVRGNLQSVDAREVFDEGERTNIATFTLSIRGNNVPTHDLRVVIDGVVYEIAQVVNPETDYRKEWVLVVVR
jgi:SPP1 family predicted phage head-tail adaptor